MEIGLLVNQFPLEEEVVTLLSVASRALSLAVESGEQIPALATDWIPPSEVFVPLLVGLSSSSFRLSLASSYFRFLPLVSFFFVGSAEPEDGVKETTG
jgi:hypothetical protein